MRSHDSPRARSVVHLFLVASAQRRRASTPRAVVMRTRDEAIEPDDDERDNQRTGRAVYVEVFGCPACCCALGAFHSELVVDDAGERRPTRLLFGSSGVVWWYRRDDFTFLRERRDVGATPPLAQSELRALVDELAREWPAASYGVLTHNCNHFAAAACAKLGVRHAAPRCWVNPRRNRCPRLAV